MRPVVGLMAAAVVCVSAVFAGENISNSPWVSWSPRAAVDSAGNFYVVWDDLYSEAGGDLFFAKYTKSDQTWSAPKNISNSGKAAGTVGHDIAGIAVDGSDTVHVVWTERSIVRLRSLSGGYWGEARTIGEGNRLEGAKVAALGSGNLYVAWWGDDGVVRSRARIDGDWESTQQVSGGRRSKSADIAAGQNSVMVTFQQKGSYYNATFVRRNTAFGSKWSGPALVSAESKDQIHPRVEFLNGTTPEVIFCYENLAGTPSQVMHCAWTGNGFGYPKMISNPASIHYPSLVEKSGVLVALWQIGGWGNGVAIYYNYYYKGQWASPMAVVGSRGSTYCDAALDPTGFALVVWDGNGEIMALIMKYEEEEPPTPNIDPVAEFSFLPTTGSAPLTVNFDASTSTDPDGTIAQYSWLFGDGKAALGRMVTHKFATPGTYTNTLTVTDNLGADNSKSKTIEVINLTPVAEFSFLPTTGSAPLKVDFDASDSQDPDGTIVRYSWGFGDGSTALGKVVTHKFATPGTYKNTLTVTDNFGETNSKSKSIAVINLAPVAAFTITSPFNIVPVTVGFDAGSSYDPDGSIVRYDWVFGDGMTSQDKNFSRFYSLPGTFSLRLTVTDNFSKQHSQTKSFTLLALQAPLNIRSESFTDVSLFQSRVVTDVRWEANPANETIAPIAKYRVFRKSATDPAAAYRLVTETDASTFFWRDLDVTAAGQYEYTVTSMDAAGHESLMPAGWSSMSSQKAWRDRHPQNGASSSIRR